MVRAFQRRSSKLCGKSANCQRETWIYQTSANKDLIVLSVNSRDASKNREEGRRNIDPRRCEVRRRANKRFVSSNLLVDGVLEHCRAMTTASSLPFVAAL